MEKKPIVVLGVEMTAEAYPILYPKAVKNPEGFAEQIQALMKTVGQEDAQSAITVLEMDIAHDHACGKQTWWD